MRDALGKGLIQLLGEQEESAVREIPVDAIRPNPRQPRNVIDEEGLKGLADSIRSVGVLQPVVVRIVGQDRYEMIAGERRWRAATLAGLERVPAVVRTADEVESLQIALIENLQREDITPLEAAEAYQALIQEFGLTQEEVARRVGKSRPAVANALRLLGLPEVIRGSLASGEISEGHARALLQFETKAEMLSAHGRVLQQGLSVREVERMARRPERARPIGPGVQKNGAPKDPHIQAIERALSERLGSPVTITRSGGGGKVSVEFFSDEDLERVLERMGLGAIDV
ncbi:MAG: ParB/RepB/Spo0J family partition protein [Armatimonadetes bacterium]|nr:ParB/RepB/Spo0J family partition protein [Armatimonadota bacterium]